MQHSRLSFATILVLLIMIGSSGIIMGQDFPKMRWLAGTWEGIGYVGKFPNPQTLTFEFYYDSLSLSLGSLLNEKLNASDSDHVHIERSGERMEIYFGGDMPFLIRHLLITKVSPDFITLSLAHPRMQEIIAIGSLKRTKKPTK